MAVFAELPIAKGEEITFDYQFETVGDPIPCRCGTKKCRKVRNISIYLQIHIVYYRRECKYNIYLFIYLFLY